MEVCLSTQGALLFSAPYIDGGKFEEAQAGQDREAGQEGVGSVSKSENVRSKETRGEKAENRGREDDERVREGEDQGGQEEQGKKSRLDIKSPDQTMHHLHQRLPQFPQQREALNDHRE